MGWPPAPPQHPHSLLNAHSLGYMLQADAFPVCLTFARMYLAFMLLSLDSFGPSNCLPGYRVYVMFTAWPVIWWMTSSEW